MPMVAVDVGDDEESGFGWERVVDMERGDNKRVI